MRIVTKEFTHKEWSELTEKEKETVQTKMAADSDFMYMLSDYALMVVQDEVDNLINEENKSFNLKKFYFDYGYVQRLEGFEYIGKDSINVNGDYVLYVYEINPENVENLQVSDLSFDWESINDDHLTEEQIMDMNNGYFDKVKEKELFNIVNAKYEDFLDTLHGIMRDYEANTNPYDKENFESYAEYYEFIFDEDGKFVNYTS